MCHDFRFLQGFAVQQRNLCHCPESVEKFFPGCEVVALPVADGGEGTVDCFLEACGGEAVKVTGVSGPYGEKIDAVYARLDETTAVVEMAAAAGLPMVGDKKDPCKTTTYGVGELVRHAVEQGPSTSSWAWAAAHQRRRLRLRGGPGREVY